MPTKTKTLGNRDPFEPYDITQITHISPQMQFMVSAIVSSLNTFRRDIEPLNGNSGITTDPANVRVLLCGDAADLRQCVNAVSEAVSDDPFILSRIIVAIEDISPFANEILKLSKPQIVEWNEADYEEYLIERVKRRNDDCVIGLAIDLSPTIRRVRRIRQLLEKDGTLIIPNERKMWRTAYPELIASFVVDGGRFLTMIDCVPGSAEAMRDSELFPPLEKRLRPIPGMIDMRETSMAVLYLLLFGCIFGPLFLPVCLPLPNCSYSFEYLVKRL
ncbi:expressed conserved protein [Echinococcus multilocularis]|uniref:Expressed conserved protein n=1 Tax=Echinococcus multilocularis TaxID=6211 RepID=A0A068YJ72_ECHMU|nr:expressed conserved protein [Echinococcus multilocularis]